MPLRTRIDAVFVPNVSFESKFSELLIVKS